MLAGASPFPGSGEPEIELLRDSGLAALILTIFATAIPTLRERLGLPWLLRVRLPIAALAFTYAALHGLLAMRADSGSSLSELLRAAAEQPALLAGVAAFVLALPLVVTSNRIALRLLGASAWQDVQRSLGIVAALATAHAIGVVSATARLVVVLLAAAALVWVVFAAARALRNRLRQPAPPAATASGQALRFYRRRPK